MANEATNRAGGVGVPVGTTIGKYEVVEKIGVGGQAIVYKCHDPLLDRHVAMKQIAPHLAEDPEFLRRFREEAKILARLGAEIITIHELIEDPQGLFIVMEYVEGHSLETILHDTNGPTEIRAALQVIWRLAATLREVHLAGIVHRDLKPSNIIVTEGLRPKIADFGVAATGSDQASMRLGTTKYMAPELFAGGRVDGRADMYSLGFIAYEMLVGRPKFNEIFAELMRDPRSEPLRWMKWHGNDQVEAPPLHEVNSQIPQDLSDIVAKMMAKDVNERFENMEALGRAMKMKFSPRARQAAAVAVGGDGRDRAKPEDVVLPEGEEADLPDEAAELEVSAEGPATAPLPKRKLSLRTRLILVGVILVSCIAIGVIIGLQERMRSEKLTEGARDAYAGAEKDYENGQYAAALESFRAVLKRYAKTTHAAKARVLSHMCKAQLALNAEDWEQAAREHKTALEDVKRVRQNSSLRQWGRRWQREIEAFEQYQLDMRAYVTQMRLARKHHEETDYGEARRVLLEEVRRYVGDFAQREADYWAFLEQVNREEFNENYDRLVKQGDERLRSGAYVLAIEAFTKAQDLVQGVLDAADTETTRGVLSKDEGRRRLDFLEERRTATKTAQQYDEAIRAASAAGSVPEKIKAYERAAKLMPSKAEELEEKIATLQADEALARARQLKERGDIGGAQRAVNESLKFKKTEEAQKLLDDLKRGGQRSALVYRAVGEMRQGKYEEALGMFEAALKIPTSVKLKEDPRTHITECRFQIQLAKADQLRKDKKYKEAAAAYEQAARIKRAARVQIDARLTAMKQQQKYEELLAQGEEALKGQKWARALEMFRQARLIMSTDEVNRKIALTRYSENLARGKAAMDQKEYKSAMGYFNLAKGFLDTKEVNVLISEAKRQLAGAGE